MNLDDELRAALRREDPSPGFAARVMARAQSRPKSRAANPRLLWGLAMAAALIITFSVTTEIRQMRAERAGREAVIALRIASEKLNETRAKVLRKVDN